MILTDAGIRYALKTELIRIEPFMDENVQPASVDLRLGSDIIVPGQGRIIDRRTGMVVKDAPKPIPPDRGWMLWPGAFALVATKEWVEVGPKLVGELVGKSTLARDGLMIECAGYVDPGWKGHLTLELKNLGNDIIVLRPNMLICQIRFHQLSVIGGSNKYPQVDRPYGDIRLNSHYQGATGPMQYEPTHRDRGLDLDAIGPMHGPALP
jgi:dCTP deaminase